MSRGARLAIPDIDEEELERSIQPFGDVYLLAVPMALYTALSNAASKKGMTVAQLLSKAFNTALKEE